MFKKKPNIKPFSPVRSSDRRKFLQGIIDEYHVELGEEEQEVKQSLLPESVQYARYITTGNESGNVYINGESGEVVWFTVEGRMIPSVSTLWRHPKLLPIVATSAFAITKVQNGADLMLPGLVPPFPEGLIPGVLTAIAVYGQESVPLAVGFADTNISSYKSTIGTKGKAVLVLHAYEDELWAMSKLSPPLPLLNVNRSDPARSKVEEEEPVENILQDLSVANDQMEKEEPSYDEMSVAEIDNAFHEALLYALYKEREAPENVSFPISSSTLVSNYIQPFFQSSHPSLQMKKTSWKKAAKFMKAMDKESILKVKDQKTDMVVMNINWTSPLIQEFHPYKLTKKKKNATQEDHDEPTSSKSLKVIDLYKPKGKSEAIIETIGKSKNSYFTAGDIRHVILEYIQKEDLTDPKEKRKIKLDPILSQALFPSPSDSYIKAATREDLIERLLNECSLHHVVLQPGEDISSRTPKRGSPPKVQILLETRQGRKTVTRLTGLEAYFVEPSQLADELRNKCASSTSVNPVPGSTSKHPQMEVLVQGPQTKAVTESLESRGIAKKHINVVDKTKKK